MAHKHHNPGCPCCLQCPEEIDSTFSPSFSSFTTAEGVINGSDWDMADGDVLVPHSVIPGTIVAWFHTFHIKSGDANITWDGLTIQYRSGPGTVSADGNAGITIDSATIIATATGGANWANHNATYGTHLTLMVTPQWYAVIVAHRRNSPLDASRGSVQVIDRDNTASSRIPTFVAVGDTKVRAVRVGSTAICPPVPTMPTCTERSYQSQIDIRNTWVASATGSVYDVQMIGGFWTCVDPVPFSLSSTKLCDSADVPFEQITVPRTCAEFGSHTPGPFSPGINTNRPSGGFASHVKIAGQALGPPITSANPHPKPAVLHQADLWSFGFATIADDVDTLVNLNNEGRAIFQANLAIVGLEALYFTTRTVRQCGAATFGADQEIWDTTDAEWTTE